MEANRLPSGESPLKKRLPMVPVFGAKPASTAGDGQESNLLQNLLEKWRGRLDVKAIEYLGAQTKERATAILSKLEQRKDEVKNPSAYVIRSINNAEAVAPKASDDASKAAATSQSSPSSSSSSTSDPNGNGESSSASDAASAEKASAEKHQLQAMAAFGNGWKQREVALPAEKQLLTKRGVYGLEESQRDADGQSKAMSVRLEPLKPGLPEFEKVLGQERQSVTIGSDKKVADIVVRGEAVSKKHTTLSLIAIHRELCLAITDNSTNGTFVNGERLPVKQKRYRIKNGATLHVIDPAIDPEFGWKLEFGATVAYFTRR